MRTLLVAGLLLIGTATFGQSKVYVVYADTVLDIANVDSAIIEVAFPVNPDSGVIFSNGWRAGYQAGLLECVPDTVGVAEFFHYLQSVVNWKVRTDSLMWKMIERVELKIDNLRSP